MEPNYNYDLDHPYGKAYGVFCRGFDGEGLIKNSGVYSWVFHSMTTDMMKDDTNKQPL